MRESTFRGPFCHLLISLSAASLVAVGSMGVFASIASADGMVSPKKLDSGDSYTGSLAESAQEAIIVLTNPGNRNQAIEDLILKIQVEADQDLDGFAWIIPLPEEPTTMEESDSALFRDLHQYVADRLRPRWNQPDESINKAKGFSGGGGFGGMADPPPVEVLREEIVGSFDIKVVRENRPAAFNQWLKDEGYHTVDFERVEGGSEIIEFYRKQEFVFVCVKVTEIELRNGLEVDLHPLRLTFPTGGRDCAFFPMLLTGLQEEPFDVNLYIFHEQPLNRISDRWGYEAFDFEEKYSDATRLSWDKGVRPLRYGFPQTDPMLRNHLPQLEKWGKLLNKLHPHQKYLMTNIQAEQLEPEKIRKWSTDLWLTPRYPKKETMPFDMRADGVVRQHHEARLATHKAQQQP